MEQVNEVLTRRGEELAAEGDRNESLGKLSDKSVEILRETGVIRMFAPKRFGGREVHPTEFAEAVMKLARLDGSTGWVAGVVGVHPWQFSMFSEQMQEELWGENVDTWTASPYAPMGVAVPVEGGFRLNGHWKFSSGTDHCDWVILGSIIGDDSGDPVQPPVFRHMVLPRNHYTIV